MSRCFGAGEYYLPMEGVDETTFRAREYFVVLLMKEIPDAQEDFVRRIANAMEGLDSDRRAFFEDADGEDGFDPKEFVDRIWKRFDSVFLENMKDEEPKKVRQIRRWFPRVVIPTLQFTFRGAETPKELQEKWQWIEPALKPLSERFVSGEVSAKMWRRLGPYFPVLAPYFYDIYLEMLGLPIKELGPVFEAMSGSPESEEQESEGTVEIPPYVEPFSGWPPAIWPAPFWLFLGWILATWFEDAMDTWSEEWNLEENKWVAGHLLCKVCLTVIGDAEADSSWVSTEIQRAFPGLEGLEQFDSLLLDLRWFGTEERGTEWNERAKDQVREYRTRIRDEASRQGFKKTPRRTYPERDFRRLIHFEVLQRTYREIAEDRENDLSLPGEDEHAVQKSIIRASELASLKRRTED